MGTGNWLNSGRQGSARTAEAELPAKPSPDVVIEHLRKILDSAAFRGSKRSQAFLSYVVRSALEGRAATLKERTLAVEIFGRSEDADLAEDTIVRVGAREVRRRLAQYYASAESAGDTVHIDLPPGSYTPEFRNVAPREESPPACPTRATRLRSRPLVLGLAAALAVAGAWVVLIRGGALRQGDAFWEPSLASPEPVLLAVAHPLVYHPSARASRLNAERNPAARGLLQQPIQVPAELLDGSDLIPVVDQYVGYGDLVAAVQLASYFAPLGKPPRIRLASRLEFADLKESPVILIGAYTNRWTIELTKDLRFRFWRTPDGRAAIEDSQPPATAWALPANRQDGLTEEDYVLLTRLVNSTTGRPLVLVAGLKHFGTEAGAGFLVNPELRAQVLSRLPSDWSRRNLQVVLRARVYGNSPARPEVLRWHCW